MQIEFVVLVVLVGVAWWVYRRASVQRNQDRKNSPEHKVEQEIAALRKMGNADAPSPPATQWLPSKVYEPSQDDDKPEGRGALRKLCREALADKAIDRYEALQLLEAFGAYSKRFENTSLHIECIRHELEVALEDGQIDARESQELVTLLGEFADVGQHPAPITPKTPEKKRVRAAPQKADRERPHTGQFNTPRFSPDGRYLMTYADASGEISEREIKPKRVERRGDHVYLVSYCLKARAPRTFRVDRIMSLIDADTGEILAM